MTDTQQRPPEPRPAFDPTDPAFIADPYPRYAELREDPYLHTGIDGAFVLTRQADVLAALRDPRLSSDPRHLTDEQRIRISERFGGEFRLPIMLFLDPPDHTRLRRLANKAFTPRVVEALRPRIAELVTTILDRAEAEAAAGRTVDIMSALAFPLPVIVICELLGVPSADHEQFKGWSTTLARALDAGAIPEVLKDGLPAVIGFVQYFSGLIEQRRQRPADDLLSALIAAEAEGDQLSSPELFAMCILLFVAGHETTTNLIGNGTLALVRHPDQMAALHDDPNLAEAATEELLRYDAPVQVTGRTVTTPLAVNGLELAKGERVVLVIGAANRDPRFCTDPDRLLLSRGQPTHVGFGGGIHFCLGASLARVEGQEVFKALSQRFPSMALAGTPQYREHYVLRGLSTLPVKFR